MFRFHAALCAALVLSSLAFAGTSSKAGGKGQLTTFTDIFCDTAVCNCASTPATQELCYESSFVIELGGEGITVRTGFAQSECLTVTVLPQKCVQICYKYRIVQRCSSWWWGCKYDSVLLSTIIHEFSASCPPMPAPSSGANLGRRALAS